MAIDAFSIIFELLLILFYFTFQMVLHRRVDDLQREIPQNLLPSDFGGSEPSLEVLNGNIIVSISIKILLEIKCSKSIKQV